MAAIQRETVNVYLVDHWDFLSDEPVTWGELIFGDVEPAQAGLLAELFAKTARLLGREGEVVILGHRQTEVMGLVRHEVRRLAGPLTIEPARRESRLAEQLASA